MRLFWVLRGHTPYQTEDMDEWSRMFESPGRTVAQEEVEGCWVSTVFVGVDQAFGMSSVPLLFETMVFTHETGDPDLDHVRHTYPTWEAAEAGHRAIVYAMRNKPLEVPK